MKKTLTLLLAAAITFTLLTLSGCAAEQEKEDFSVSLQIGNPVMTVNGEKKEIDPGRNTSPVIINDRTLLPVRAIVEEMGGNVGWNGEKEEVTLSYEKTRILLTINSKTVSVNGEISEIDTPPVIINDRTMLPIRFIAESFGFSVGWDEETRTVTIRKQADTDAPAAAEQIYIKINGKTLTADLANNSSAKKLLELLRDCVSLESE